VDDTIYPRSNWELQHSQTPLLDFRELLLGQKVKRKWRKEGRQKEKLEIFNMLLGL